MLVKKLLNKLLGKPRPTAKGQTTSSQLGTLYQDGFFETEKTMWINEHLFRFLLDTETTGDTLETKVPSPIKTEIQAFVTEGSQHMPIPRQPLLLPKLLHVINNPKSGLSDIISLINSDPKLASEVINQANSAYYRVSSTKVTSIKRAIDMLGNNGLRRVATNIAMSPIINIDSATFPEFSNKLWKLSIKSALAAEEFSRQYSTGAEKGYLLGLLSSLGPITLYQLVMKYHKASQANLDQTAKVLYKTLNVYKWRVTHKIFEDWQLPVNMLKAINEHERQTHPNQMSNYGAILYRANLCASVHTLIENDIIASDKGRLILLVQGVLKSHIDSVFEHFVQSSS